MLLFLKVGETVKRTEEKLAYIKARGEGKSYSTIARELGISKSTCSSWEKELKEDIQAYKEDALEELYTSYNMTKEARVKKLGEVLATIDTALEKKDLTEVPAEKLLELKLKYERELKTEYIEPLEDAGEDTLEDILEQYNKFYIGAKQGKYSPAQIKAQLSILDAKKATMNAIEADKWSII